MPGKLWFLKRCRLFEQLRGQEIEQLEARSRVRTLPKNTTIYLPTDPGQAVFLVAEGRVKIFHLTPDGKQSILAFVESGERFGELALLDSGPRDEFAETVERSTIVLIPRDVLGGLVQQRPDLALGITKALRSPSASVASPSLPPRPGRPSALAPRPRCSRARRREMRSRYLAGRSPRACRTHSDALCLEGRSVPTHLAAVHPAAWRTARLE